MGLYGLACSLLGAGLSDEPWRSLVSSAGRIARLTPSVDGEPDGARYHDNEQGLPVEADEAHEETHGCATTVVDEEEVVLLLLTGAFQFCPASL